MVHESYITRNSVKVKHDITNTNGFLALNFELLDASIIVKECFKPKFQV
jgi:hypothetical protein